MTAAEQEQAELDAARELDLAVRVFLCGVVEKDREFARHAFVCGWTAHRRRDVVLPALAAE